MTTTLLSGQSLPAPCEHKAETGCMLTALPCCCSCADRRPHATTYPVYVDGQGMKMQGRRWQRYCRRCYDHWESSIQPLGSSSLPALNAMQMQTMATFVSDENRQPQPRAAVRGNLSESTWAETAASQRLIQNTRRTGNRTDNHRHPSPGHPGHASRRNRARQPLAPLGTREDVMQPGYESPIGNIFTRAWGRYRDAEEVRQAQRESDLRLQEERERDATQYGFENPFARVADNVVSPSSRPIFAHPEQVPERRAIEFGLNFHARHYGGALDNANRLRQSIRNLASDLGRFETLPADDLDSSNSIDTQDRPPARTDGLLVDISCKVCLEQRIDTLVEPCMHACMCHWCAQVWRTQAREAAATGSDLGIWRCPVCRKMIRQYRRFHLC